MRKSGFLSGKFFGAVKILIMTVVFLVAFSRLSEVKAWAAAEDIQYVIDEAGLLSESEEESLNKLCNKVSKNCGIDMIVVTLKNGYDYEEFDNYMEKLVADKYGNYKYSDNEYSAVVYGIDIKSRADRFCATGKARVNVSDGTYSDMCKKSESYLSEDDYYAGIKSFVKGVNVKLNDSIVFKLFYKWYIKLAISVVVAVIVVLIMMYNAKAQMSVSSTTYTKDHKFKVNAQRDVFINTTVVTRRIQSNNGGGRSGGGGGDHSGHGGGHF